MFEIEIMVLFVLFIIAIIIIQLIDDNTEMIKDEKTNNKE